MNGYEAVARALRKARPDGLLTALRGSLGAHYDAVRVDLLLADYGMTALCHVSEPHEEHRQYSLFNSESGRVFGAQERLVDRKVGPGLMVVRLPVSVRGDRLGVLTVELPGQEVDERTLGDLEWIAQTLGREILVAERDTDYYRAVRRRDRLTLAAEMQWDLLAGRAYECPEYSIGAQLEPAYAIRGDNFDWSAAADHLQLSVSNGMGEGIDASLLTSLAVNALRNARRAGVPLADQVALADKAVYAQHGGERYLDVLALSFDTTDGTVEVVDAGSPRLFVLRDDTVSRFPFDAQMPLGMAEDTIYTAQHFEVRPGDRLVFISDGVFDAQGPGPESFGTRALMRSILSTRLLPAASVPQEVLRNLNEYRQGIESLDDALVVCLDWRGKG
ncbi:PP2C family protein-serine/threonine phosphatase [Nocardiopsis sp. MG754419]|uniref:PP2C family protein-serine/threonine phosphatase n=1 Tax=Nocardiopsis sp. MG754419 TaxID=2259865 RepID=UPI001BADAC4E|nr:PP2C family protein-serine/threonine phosphatase [Nocardiopsis sp. MG754419]MBR8741717.1 phosphatase [Nocardiopsis sp. MG754419]